jgi:hypothetical protein
MQKFVIEHDILKRTGLALVLTGVPEDQLLPLQVYT